MKKISELPQTEDPAWECAQAGFFIAAMNEDNKYRIKAEIQYIEQSLHAVCTLLPQKHTLTVFITACKTIF